MWPAALLGGSALLSVTGGFLAAAGAQTAAAYQSAGARAKAQAEAGALRFNADAMDFAATVNERDRGIAFEQAAADIRDQGRKHVAQRGQVRAAFGWSGLAIEGSQLDVLEALTAEQTLDIRKTLYTSEVVGAGLTDQAAQNRAKASMLRASADNAITAGELAASGYQSAAGFQSAAAILGGFTGALRAGANYMMPGAGRGA